jgi:hypothetical protein
VAVEFIRRTVIIDPGTGERRIPDRANFEGDVIRAHVALQGFRLDFANADHHINVIDVDVDLGATNHPNIEGRTVNFTVDCLYADRNFDDSFSGYIDVLVIAETTYTGP